MKTLKQFLTESDSDDKAHFIKHAKAYIKHANIASEQEENSDDHPEDASDESWERSRHHANEIQKRFGSAGRNYVGHHVGGEEEDFDHHWNEFSKKRK